MSDGPAASLPTSAEKLRALVVEQWTVIAAQERRIAVADERIAELERRLGRDSSTSNRPPSSDSPYRKLPPRSSRRASGRKPGKQPGAPGSAMGLVEDPDEAIILDPGCCWGVRSGPDRRCGDRVSRRQVTDVCPPPRRG